MAATKTMRSAIRPGEAQSIEVLQQRYSALHTQKIQAETNLKNAEGQLGKIQREVREKFGTDDLNVLRQMLADMKQENEAKCQDYQARLDKIETDLAEVEETFAAVETSFDTESGK